MTTLIRNLEGWFERTCIGAGHTIDLLWRSFLALRHAGRRRRDILDHTSRAVFGAMPVVFVIAFFVGMIVAIQTGHQLQRFDQQSMLGFIVPVGMVREMGPVFTALALAGLVGSTYAASIGTMKVSEEIDALEVMSIDPIYFLAMPRIIALGFASVVLTIYADLIGIIGGGIVSAAVFQVDPQAYWDNARDALGIKDLWSSLLKAAVFGLTVASIACSQGMRAGQGAQGVGDATMRSVVRSMICILIFDYILSWFLL